MNTKLSTFTFETNSIRTLIFNNDPWFIAVDVCKALDIKNVTQALGNLDEDERAMFNIGLDQKSTFDHRVSEINIISESGMYTLILRCREAVKKGSVPHRFRKWVTAEVLPAIRKTGKYEQLKTTVDDRTGLRDAVNLIVGKKGLSYSDAYNLVHQYMNVKSIEDIPQDKLSMAVAYCHRIVLEGELIIEPPKKEITVSIPGAGRWLVIANCVGETRIVDASGHAMIPMEANRKLLRDVKTMGECMVELAHRMRIVDGECSESRLDKSIMEMRPKMII